MIQYIIFDFDGTLADSKEVFLRVLNHISAKRKMKTFNKSDVERLIRLPMSERCKEINMPMYKLPLFAPEFYHHYKDHLQDIVLVDGIRELLKDLVGMGYKLAIISSNSESIIREFLKQNKIDCIQDIFCSSNLFGKDKVIRKFLREYKLDPSEIIYVGDEHRDVTACKKCGVKVIWVGWGYDIPELVLKEEPDYIANEPSDILKVL